MSEQQKKKPWYMELPDPKSTVEGVEAEEVLGWIENADKVVGRDYLLVDVRKDDHEGGTIAGSLNLPGQTFMDMRPTLLNLVAGVGVKSVVFYCGSCLGRGPRVAGWFKDYVEEQNNKNIDVLYLKGGIKGWVKDGYTAKMDSFDPKAWKL